MASKKKEELLQPEVQTQAQPAAQSAYSAEGLNSRADVEKAMANVSYRPGQQVTDAADALKQWQQNRPADYQSSYQDKINSLLGQLLERENFQYSYTRDPLYRQYEQQTMDPLHRNLQAAFGKDELIDGIPSSDWMTYIGTAAPAYLNDYSRMQLQHTKISLSFSALLFGPFYFFYRKAWKPAFAFLAAELLLFVPTLLQMMQITGSSLSLGLSDSTYVVLGRVVSLASFALMLVRGMFAKWFYRKSAAEHIRRIRAEFPDDAQRSVVLSAQGGVSWGAVLGSLLLLMVFGACCSMLLGPNLDVLLNALS